MEQDKTEHMLFAVHMWPGTRTANDEDHIPLSSAELQYIVLKTIQQFFVPMLSLTRHAATQTRPLSYPYLLMQTVTRDHELYPLGIPVVVVAGRPRPWDVFTGVFRWSAY